MHITARLQSQSNTMLFLFVRNHRHGIRIGAWSIVCWWSLGRPCLSTASKHCVFLFKLVEDSCQSLLLLNVTQVSSEAQKTERMLFQHSTQQQLTYSVSANIMKANQCVFMNYNMSRKTNQHHTRSKRSLCNWTYSPRPENKSEINSFTGHFQWKQHVWTKNLKS